MKNLLESYEELREEPVEVEPLQVGEPGLEAPHAPCFAYFKSC